MKTNFGDIFLVKFHPSIGSELKRFRPAVVISSKEADPRFTTIVPITSNSRKYPYPFSVKIKNSSLDKKEQSSILPWYIKTIDKLRLEKKLGQLSKEENESLKMCILKIIN